MYTIKINTKEYRTFCLHQCEIYKDMIRQENVQSLETATQNTQDLSALVITTLLQLKNIMQQNGDSDKLYDIVLETNNRNIISILNTKSSSNKKIKKFSQYCRNLVDNLNIKVMFSESDYPRLLKKYDTTLWCFTNEDNNTVKLKLNNKHTDGLNSKFTYTNKDGINEILIGLEQAINLGLRYKGVYFKTNNTSLIIVDDYRVIELLNNLDTQTANSDTIKNILYNLRLLNCDIGLIPKELNLAKEVL
ncbi:hypothetical protein [uncultured Clostridium sp.]|uniref:hypothetical protein n=1 Tax=uncultured Clostridium sp. TaxID=59620 RepID=UPI0026F3D437|nr:hypothetical protein [uncultured Clostridium sp.]